MATTVKVLAKELKRTAPDLLEQLKAAGIEKGSEDDSITEKDKTVLLEHLQKAHGSADTGARKKITLIKRESSEIRQADSAGRTRTVQVEVRKKRVLVKAGDKPAEATPEAAPAKAETKATPAKPIISEEELEKRAAEATRQAELLARQEAEMKAAEEARQKEVAAPAPSKEEAPVDEAPAAAALAAAEYMAGAITESLGGRGLFGVEMFIKGDEVIFSEVSPRPHDTGIVTLISQDLSEFALHVRAILGLPIPNIRQHGPSASCAVLVEGESNAVQFAALDQVLAEPDTQMRLFGKPAVSGQRRMAVTLARANDITEARAKACRAAQAMEIRL